MGRPSDHDGEKPAARKRRPSASYSYSLSRRTVERLAAQVRLSVDAFVARHVEHGARIEDGRLIVTPNAIAKATGR